MTAPKGPQKSGQRRPARNERAVPETAPTAKRTPNASTHRRAIVPPALVAGAQVHPLGDEQEGPGSPTRSRRK